VLPLTRLPMDNYILAVALPGFYACLSIDEPETTRNAGPNRFPCGAWEPGSISQQASLTHSDIGTLRLVKPTPDSGRAIREVN